jgi:hypothetical protein
MIIIVNQSEVAILFRGYKAFKLFLAILTKFRLLPAYNLPEIFVLCPNGATADLMHWVSQQRGVMRELPQTASDLLSFASTNSGIFFAVSLTSFSLLQPHTSQSDRY